MLLVVRPGAPSSVRSLLVALPVLYMGHHGSFIVDVFFLDNWTHHSKQKVPEVLELVKD